MSAYLNWGNNSNLKEEPKHLACKAAGIDAALACKPTAELSQQRLWPDLLKRTEDRVHHRAPHHLDAEPALVLVPTLAQRQKVRFAPMLRLRLLVQWQPRRAHLIPAAAAEDRKAARARAGLELLMSRITVVGVAAKVLTFAIG